MHYIIIPNIKAASLDAATPHKMLKKTIFQCMNLPLITVGIASVVFGTAAAVIMGNAEVLPAILSLFFAVMLQVSANIFHRYCEFDQSGHIFNDLTPEHMDNLPVKKVLKDMWLGLTIMALLIGISIFTLGGWWTLIPAAILALLIYLYNWGGGALSRTPLAIIFPFAGFGIIGVTCTSFLQTSHGAEDPFALIDTEPSFWLACVCGLLAINVLLAHNLCSYERDILRGRKTFGVTVGSRNACTLYFFNSILVWFVMIGFGKRFLFHSPYIAMIGPTVVTIANVILGIMMTKKKYSHDKNIQVWVGIMMLALALWCLILFSIMGKPDDSTTTFFRTY